MDIKALKAQRETLLSQKIKIKKEISEIHYQRNFNNVRFNKHDMKKLEADLDIVLDEIELIDMQIENYQN